MEVRKYIALWKFPKYVTALEVCKYITLLKALRL